MNIGIEKHFNLIYEGPSNYGIPIWPSPILIQVIIATEDDDEFKASSVNQILAGSG